MSKLSNNDKKEIIHALETGKASQRELAKRYKIGKGSIQRILAMKNEILQQSTDKILKSRRPKFEEVDRSTFEVFLRLREENIAVSGPMIQNIALKIANSLEIKDFTASSGWLDRFKQRNDLKFKKLVGESASADHESAISFIKEFEKIRKSYKNEEIFNCDETGLFYKMLPNSSFTVKNATNSNIKKDKKRISVLLCCSFTGEKLNPIFIGNSKHPRALAGLDLSKLEIYYRFNKKAWMTSDIFCEWLREINESFKQQKRNVLLLLDNCSSHFNIPLSNIRLLFIPPNTSSIIQPLDAGIIKTFKDNYRNKLLMMMLGDLNGGFSEKYKKINIKDAIFWSKVAWNEIKISTITKCFNNSLTNTPETEVETKSTLFENNVIEGYINDVLKEVILQESSDSVEEPETTLNWNSFDGLRIFYELKNYVSNQCPSFLQKVYELEHEILSEIRAPKGSLWKYFK